jgi:hypothetical protein
MGPSSNPGDGETELLVQLFEVIAHHVVHLDVLEMVPAAFIPRIEIGGIGRQRLQLDSAVSARHVFLDGQPAVNRRAVSDDQEPFARRSQHVIEELDRVQPVERLLPCQGVDLPHRRHPVHHRQMVVGDLLPNDRSLPFGGVGLDHSQQERFLCHDAMPRSRTRLRGIASRWGPSLSTTC